jgi:hypothetical protein
VAAFANGKMAKYVVPTLSVLIDLEFHEKPKTLQCIGGEGWVVLKPSGFAEVVLGAYMPSNTYDWEIF